MKVPRLPDPPEEHTLRQGLRAAGAALPASPANVFAEDFSVLIRRPRRLRFVRGEIRVLS